MKDIRKTWFTLPITKAIDIDVLSSRYNLNQKNTMIALINLGLDTLQEKDSFSKETFDKLITSLACDEFKILKNKEEDIKYAYLLEARNANKFQADEEKIEFISGIGDF